MDSVLKADLHALRRALRQEGYRGCLESDLSRRIPLSTDNSIYQVVPALVAVPHETDDLARLVRANRAFSMPFSMVARGGGTGTNGQSLTPELLVDCSRLRRVCSIDPASRRAWVEPGVVLDQLNRSLAADGLFFAPHVSTSSRATLGGMVATDAAGKGSRIYGRTAGHVIAVRLVTADGEEHELRPMPWAEARRRAQSGEGSGPLLRRCLAALDGRHAEIQGATPQLERGFSGYNLARACGDELFDPTALICGSEGSLGLISGIEVRLTKLPAAKAVVIVDYDDFQSALRDVPALLSSDPAAVEVMDERTQRLGRRSVHQDSLHGVLSTEAGCSLFVELVDEDPRRLESRLQGFEGLLAIRGSVRRVELVRDPRTQKALWALRKDAVGLLAKGNGSARPTAFVEDCAVPTRHLADFIADFTAVLDEAGLSYGMYGHADAGCVHVRPALDLSNPVLGRQTLRRVSDRVEALTRRYGGVLWGEHGIGFRGQYLADRLEPELYRLMVEVKRAFDPDGLFNPDKLYGSDARSLPNLDAVPMRADRDAQVHPESRRRYADAFRCNGNGACHRLDPAGLMCPSFQATGDDRQSPKGRTDLLREWLRREAVGDPDPQLRADLKSSLDGCLSCKACTTRCPAEVDIPELKSRFLESYHRSVRRPWRDRLLLGLESFGPWLARRARWINRGLSNPLSRVAARRLGLVDLPRFSDPPLQDRLARLGAEPASLHRNPAGTGSLADVVLSADPFTSLFDAGVLVATYRLMQGLGFSPAVFALGPSGKFEHVKGFRRRFEGTARQRLEELDKLSRRFPAAPVVAVEPAVALMYTQEYPQVSPDNQERARILLLQDWLLEVLPEAQSPPPPADGEVPKLLVHCTERAARPRAGSDWRTVFERLGLELQEVETGCCGMAGIFGHEVENAAVSRRLFDRGWRDAVDTSGTALATGFSCRCQIRRFIDRRPLHPAEYLLLHSPFLPSSSTVGST